MSPNDSSNLDPLPDDQTVASSGDGPGASSPGWDPASPVVGRAFGPFRIERELGRGGQGSVYLAEDSRLGRRVALKVLLPQFVPSPSALERFHREAASASRLDHPGICGIYEAGVIRGVQYISMRFVEGESLAERISNVRELGLISDATIATPSGLSDPSAETVAGGASERPMAPTGSTAPRPESSSGPARREEIFRVLQIVEKAARALHAAHEVGLIHRDIKPGNILVTPAGDPVILDFGLAREEDHGSELTVSGDLLGTPAYMSPEQIAAQRISLDRRTDVYSLGVTLYECLTLRRPFDAATREGLYQQILSAQVPDPRRYNRHLGSDLRVVLETAIERDRERRYASALEFAEDLRRVREFEPIHARPAGPVLRFQRWMQRNPVLATSTISLFVILTVALVISLVLLDRVRRAVSERDTALEGQTTALGELQTALAEVNREGALKAAALVDRERALEKLREESAAKEDALRSLEGALGRVRDESELKAAALEEAESERDRAASLYRTTRAAGALATNPVQAILLATDGDGSSDPSLANEVLASALSQPLPVHSLGGHEGAVVAVAVSPDARYFASCARAAWIWDLASGRPLALLPDRFGDDARIEFVGDGTLLLAADSDGVRLWSVPAGREILLWTPPPGDLLASAHASPDGERLIVSGSFGVEVLSVATGARVSVFEPHALGSGFSIFSPDGLRAVSASASFAASRRGGAGRSSSSGAGRPGGRSPREFSGRSGLGSVHLFDPVTGESLLELADQRWPVSQLLFSPDGRYLVSVSPEGSRTSNPALGASVHDASNGELFYRSESESSVVRVAFSPDGQRFAELYSPGRLEIRPVVFGERPWSSDAPSSLARIYRVALETPIAFLPEGRVAVLLEDSRTIGIVSARGEILRELRGHGDRVRSLAVDRSGRYLVSGGRDGVVVAWDLDLPAVVSPAREISGPGTITEDGSRWITSFDGSTRTLDLVDGTERVLRNPGSSERAEYTSRGAFLPGGQVAMVFAGTGELHVFDANGRRALFPAPSPRFLGNFAPRETPPRPLDLDATLDGRWIAWTEPGAAFVVDLEAVGPFSRSRIGAAGTERVRFAADGERYCVLRRAEAEIRGLPEHEVLRTISFGTDARRGAAVDLALSAELDRLLVLEETGRAALFRDDASVLAELPERVDRLVLHASGDRVLLLRGPSASILELANGRETPFAASISGIQSVASTRSGDRWVALSSDGKLTILSGGGDVLRRVECEEAIRAASFDREGARIVASTADGQLRAFDALTGGGLSPLPWPVEGLVTSTFSCGPDGRVLVQDDRSRLSLLTPGEEPRQIRKAVERAGVVRETPVRVDDLASRIDLSGGSIVDHDSEPFSIFVRSLESGDEIARVDLPFVFGRILGVHRDGRMVAAEAFDPESGGRALRAFTERRADLARRTRRDGGVLVARLDSGPATLREGRELTWLELEETGLDSAVFDEEGTRVALVAQRGVTVASIATGEVLGRLQLASPIARVRFQPAGRALLVAATDLYLWTPGDEEAAVVRSSEGGLEPGAFAFSPGGEQFVSGDSSGRISRHPTARATADREWAAHNAAIVELVFSADARWLASAAGDQVVRLWRVEDGKLWNTFRLSNPIAALRFDREGTHLVVLEDRVGKVHRFPIDPGALARRLVARELSAAERDRFEIGSPTERAAQFRAQEGRRLVDRFALATRAAESDPDSVRAKHEMRRVLDAMRANLEGARAEGVPEPALVDVGSAWLVAPRSAIVLEGVALLAAATGDIRTGVELLERAARVGSIAAESRAAASRWRAALHPQLVSYAAMDDLFDWTPIVAEGDEWRFFRGRQEPDPRWIALDFDDSGWETGRSGFGYGDNDDATRLDDMLNAYSTVFVRHAFDLESVDGFEDARLRIFIDDGFVAFLNGVEVGRFRIRSSDPVDSKLLATAFSADGELVTLPLLRESFRPGKNVIAVVGVNRQLDSTDLSLIPELSVRRTADGARSIGERFREIAGPEARLRLAYLEARMAEARSEHETAARRYRSVLLEDPSALEPALGLLRSIDALDDPARAQESTRWVLERSQYLDAEIVSRHFRLQLARGESLEELVRFGESFGGRPGTADPGEWIEHAQDLTRGAVRINCGAHESYVGSDGVVWRPDRFFGGGVARGYPPRSIADTEDDFLHLSERDFPDGSGYRIPAPPGRYRVRLGFSEIYHSAPGQRVFSILVDGTKVWSSYEPRASGFGRADELALDLDSSRGEIDISFEREKGLPKISWIAIDRVNASD